MSLATVIVSPSLTAMPADSWPRCWSANRPRYVRCETDCPGPYTPKTPHACPGVSSWLASGRAPSAPGSEESCRESTRPSSHIDRGAHDPWEGLAPRVRRVGQRHPEGAVGLQVGAAGVTRDQHGDPGRARPAQHLVEAVGPDREHDPRCRFG